MFSDVGPLELATLAVLAILLFGPDRLPEFIQNAAALIRKFREFSDNAKQEIRSELGPEFADFEFEDLHPKTFVRKHVLDDEGEGDDEGGSNGLALGLGLGPGLGLGLGLDEIRNSLDPTEELTEAVDALRSAGDPPPERAASPTRVNLTKESGTEATARAPINHFDAT
ncbi:MULTISPECIES: sec-independent translocase [unclassified Streptomyces]|jgi:sec-independent protein translocase protein TatB|uniref:sec-independent translocase n=1 Tax=unclassified Streptomyces TaxID=2593676 RepID=UPI00081AF2A6|nr:MULTISPECIES: sec-independent translocase [unclassified Streptomyces]MYQ83412.1 preprotein translocase [Streptomyces sp. SID4936]SCD65867.1 sec-independent protein translocase protein TatB [Streptomyces sp. DvalAA-43]